MDTFIAADINYLAVLVSAVCSIVIGYLWFGPLFGKAFAKGRGVDTWSEEKKAAIESNKTSTYIKQFIMSLVMAFVVAYVVWMYRLAIPELGALMAGIQTGFWLWIGIAVPVRYSDSLWNGQEFKYTAIDLGYWLLLLVLYGTILSVWQ